MHFLYNRQVYHPTEASAWQEPIASVSVYEPRDYAYLDTNTLLNVLDNVPGALDLLQWSARFNELILDLTTRQHNFYQMNQGIHDLFIERWKDHARKLTDRSLIHLQEIREKFPRRDVLDPLIERIDLFKKALPNWSIQQAIYNFNQLVEISTQAISTLIGLSAYSDSELKHRDTMCLKAITHPAHQYFQREVRGEALRLYSLGALIHLLEHVCSGSIEQMSEFGKARAIGECKRILDFPLPKHPDHLEILSKGIELIDLSIQALEKNSDHNNFVRFFTVIRRTVSILQAELDHVSWRHHGTQNVFENRIPVQEEIHNASSRYTALALERIQRAIHELSTYLTPVKSNHVEGAMPVFPPIFDDLNDINAFLELRNELVIDPAQFVRIRIFSKDIPPTREILREAQVIQNTRLGPDALLAIQPEKELRRYIESGKLSYVSVSISNKQLAFFAISTDQEKLTSSGQAAIDKLSKLERYQGVSFAFVELVASDITTKFRLKPWVRGAWSFVSAAGESLALNSYKPDDRVVLALIARDGITAEGVYAASGFKKTEEFLTLEFAGGFHRYFIWAKELGGDIVSL